MDRQLADHISKRGDRQQTLQVTIPVVVHVVYGNANQNITDAQILSQIAVLNADYGRTNADTSNTPSAFQSVAANTEIEFCMAERDPNGNSTDGITRTSTSVGSFSDFFNDIKFDSTGGKNAWPRDEYLNIWVGNLQGNILGYAQFPGLGNAATDGVVIDFKYFGSEGSVVDPYDLGRTTTHEVGHWLGLYHIWGDDGGACTGSDQVNDTPEQGDSYYDCPVHPSVSCGSDDMFMNFLDYTDDICMNLFTNGQKTRMHATLDNFRENVKYSVGCVPHNQPVYDAAIVEVFNPDGPMCSNDFTPLIRFSNQGVNTITHADLIYRIDGGSDVIKDWVGSLAQGESMIVPLKELNLNDGSYTFDVEVRNPNQSGDVDPTNNNITTNFTVAGTGSGNLTIPFSEGFESVGIPAGWDTLNPNHDQAWLWVNNAGANGSSSSMMFNNFSNLVSSTGNLDDLVTPYFDFSNGAWSSMTFYIAHARRSGNESDTLAIYSSIDCGVSWLEIWKIGGDDLITSANTNSMFIPAGDFEWKQEYVGLNFLKGNEKVMFMFRNITDQGNAIYLDDINLSQATTAISKTPEPRMQIWPSPSHGMISLSIHGNVADSYEVKVLDLLGQIHHQQSVYQDGTMQDK